MMRILVIFAALLLVPAARLSFQPHAKGIGRHIGFNHRLPASASMVGLKTRSEEGVELLHKLHHIIGNPFFRRSKAKPFSQEPGNQEPGTSDIFRHVWQSVERMTQNDKRPDGHEEDQTRSSSLDSSGFFWNAGERMREKFSKHSDKRTEEEQGREEAKVIESELLPKEELISRKLLVAGFAAQPVIYAMVRTLSSSLQQENLPLQRSSEGPYSAAKMAPAQTILNLDPVSNEEEPAPISSTSLVLEEGYSGQLPLSEERIIDAWEAGRLLSGSQEILEDIKALESRKGAEFEASGQPGRWVLPWIGGWQQIYSSDPDCAYIGGPLARSLKKGNQSYYQYSARNFFYGPGPGGMTTEYLYKPVDGHSDDTVNNVLLARSGVLENEGDNRWTVIFPDPLQEFETETTLAKTASFKTFEKEVLISDKAVAPIGEPAPHCRLQTTYLSQMIWVVRDAARPEKVAVYKRTQTESVVDRRGLVAEGQVKPPQNDNIRFGGLLFSDKKFDYGAWDEKVLKDEELKKKFLG